MQVFFIHNQPSLDPIKIQYTFYKCCTPTINFCFKQLEIGQMRMKRGATHFLKQHY
ncbi:hypothetical protein RO3G_02526 [Rhizopus delemar RA 99-880]|uniref:Uncharacterized protein n=1 Tax=Rhizopus delemar (strain RA 99-880 / ATCC MYA-4621 / FGSC 9543 / NRRL 43880) TaxID=246409 RepID=I1BNP2_RHIO9|nr:hypothetical protein RO3G_02526 [Rhizopus delemar RA 99-880]|eukprot:EIE77822.1 hypothetical protein RO3G_02526 [Rhizopus delemar RA 99-880]